MEPSTRSGRRFAKLSEGNSVIGVELTPAKGKPKVLSVSRKSRVLICAASEISYLNGPGRGVVLLKLDDDDQLVGFKIALGPDDVLVVKTSLGGEQKISLTRQEMSSRGAKGRQEIIKRGRIREVVPTTPVAPQLSGPNGAEVSA